MIKHFKDWLLKPKYSSKEWSEDVINASVEGHGVIEAKVEDLTNFIISQKYSLKTYNVKELYDMGSGKHIKDEKYWEEVLIWYPKANDFVLFYDLPEDFQTNYKSNLYDRVMRSKLEFPLVVAEIKNNPVSVVDGNHRLEKAYLFDKEELQGYSVPWNDLLKRFKV